MDETKIAEEGKKLFTQAEKAAKGNILSFLSGGPDLDKAAQLYTLAANKYKQAKLWQPAAECMILVASLQNNLNDPNSEAKAYVDAADLIKRYARDDSVEYYVAAEKIYSNHGRFAQSGKLSRGLAEMYEEEGNFDRACHFYKSSASFFEMDDYSKSPLSQCRLKYAELASRYLDRNDESIAIFEAEGFLALKNSLMQYGAKEHFLRAGILLLAAGDPVDAKIKIEKYEQADPRFASSREMKFLKELGDAFEEKNVDRCVTAIQEFDSITRLDGWKIHFLYRIKESMAPCALAPDGAVDFT